jgi:uncharacterized paraquat-inducible protein A
MTPEDQHPAYHDNMIAIMYRLDPEKIAAVRRAISGMTRCPGCDALNRADQGHCIRCGAKLYPEVKDEESPKEE